MKLFIVAVTLCAVVLTTAAAASAAKFGPCDPLVPELCMYPFPNNFWLRNNSAGQLRLDLSNDTLPISKHGVPVRTDYGGWDSLDGFSPIPAIQTYLPDASIDNCARLWNISRSMDTDSPTVLLDATTGEKIPHWVELDHYSDHDYPNGYARAIMIWPQERLESQHRYVVGLRSFVYSTNGSAIEPSAAFKALRDSIPTTDPNIEGRRALFKQIFAELGGAGVSQHTLQLAWDFTVQSTEVITGRLVSMRDDALDRLGKDGFKYKVYSVENNVSTTVARRLQVTVQVPWYLNQAGPGSSVRLVLGKDGLPVYQGLQPVNYTILVPHSLVNNGTTGGVLQYGHGLFGSRSEVNEGYLDNEANEHGWVLAAADWLGLSEYDEIAVGLMLATDLSNFAMVPDRCHQGMLNALVLMRFMSTAFVHDPTVTFNGKTVIDPSKRFYYGNSQGGILGTVYMGATTDVERGVIGVGGAPYELLLPRSVDFTILGDLMGANYPDPQARIGLLAGIQLLWNRLEPAGYLHAISKDPLPNTPKHRILIHYGLGDAQVTWMGGQQIGRATDAVMFQGNVAEGNITIDGFKYVPDDTIISEGNAIVGWDFGEPVVPFINVAPNKKYDTHEFTRRTKTAQDMTHIFFETGNIVNTCGGPCHAKPPM